MHNTSPTSGRIAILNAHWRVHTSVCDIANSLVKAGYLVDVFIYASNIDLSKDLLQKSPSMNVYLLDEMTTPRPEPNSESASEPRKGLSKIAWKLATTILPQRFRRWLWHEMHLLLIKLNPEDGLIPHWANQQVADLAGQHRYDLLFAVEKGGLYWAGKVSEQTRIPMVYYSLELFSRDVPELKDNLGLIRLQHLEGKYHRKCAMTLVQDVERGKVLLAYNKVRRPMKMAYLPISCSGEIHLESSGWLQKECGLSRDNILILSYGRIAKDRFCDELARVSQSFPESWRLIFHGLELKIEQELEEIRQLDRLGRIGVSLRMVPAADQKLVVRSAHIGLALYSTDSRNNILTGFSSEKIALYFRCGKPLIAFRYPSYEHIEQEGCGVLVDRIEEIPAAAQKILSNYDSYSQNAYECYKRHYCLEANFPPVLASLRQVILDSQAT